MSESTMKDNRIDAHGWKSWEGEGGSDFGQNSWKGGGVNECFFSQNRQGTPYFDFYCIFIKKKKLFAWGVLWHTPFTPPPPLFSFMDNRTNMQQLLIMPRLLVWFGLFGFGCM